MRRFFLDKSVDIGEEVILDAEESRHMLTVLRMNAGDRLILINGSGCEMTAEILREEADRAVLKVLSAVVSDAEPANNVVLFQGLPKAGKLDLIIQKCVELGISAIRPVSMKRCVVKPEKNDGKLARFNRISHEAAKQCLRSKVPEVYAPVKLTECDFSAFDLVLVAFEGEEKLTLKLALEKAKPDLKHNADIALVIGPEGGFDESEVEYLLASNKNAFSVSLGKRILRTETAGLAMLSMLMYELEG